MPELSIIVAVYNIELYLHRCIDSILAQSFTDFECILVDDGSTDTSGSICDEYKKKDNRIKVIHKANGGQSSARNMAMDISCGKYIGFVDGDDFIHPRMYEILLDVAWNEEADIVQCEFKKVTDADVKIEEIGDYTAKTYSVENLLNKYYDDWQLRRDATWSKVFRAELLQKHRFPEGYLYEDSTLYIQVLAHTREISFVPCQLYYYYMRENSTTHMRYTVKHFSGKELVYKTRLAVFREKNLKPQEYGALEEYLNFFCKSMFLVYSNYPELKDEFKRIKKNFEKEILNITNNPQICRMKKCLMYLSLINVTLSYLLAKKYFPELTEGAEL